MKRTWVLHPFLFAAYPVLFLLAHNPGQTSYGDAGLPLAAVVASSLLAMGVARLLKWNLIKTGSVLSLFWIVFTFYGHLFELLRAFHFGGFSIGRHRYLVPALFALSLLVVRFTLRIRDQANLNRILNSVGLVLIFICTAQILVSLLQSRPAATSTPAESLAPEIGRREKPDIYYLILDGYGHADTLRDIYGYDNQTFLRFLTDQGFYVASAAHSNYAMTILSLASSLNMDYLDRLGTLREMDDRPASLSHLIQDSRASRELKAQGYKFIQFGSGWYATDRNPYADAFSRFGKFDEFVMMFVESTLLRVIDRYLLLSDGRDRILKNFDALAELPEMQGPKFVFVHFVIPHPPYYFGASGEPVPDVDLSLGGGEWVEKNHYRNQLVFANSKVKALITSLLSKSHVPPIIMVQGDHGPAATFEEPGHGTWAHPDDTNLQERMRIFSAYFVPPEIQKFLYPSITPVNSFRLLLNHPLIKDRSFFSNYDHRLDFTDVTGRVRFPGQSLKHE